MEEFNKSQKIKLKPIKLKELLYRNKLKPESNKINNIKTERPNIITRNKRNIINLKNPYKNTLNTTYLLNHNKSIEYSKNKSPLKKNKLPSINKITIKKKEKKEIKRNSIVLQEGYTNYLKLKTNKIYERMKRLLFEEKIKRLSLPKYRKNITFEKTKKNKNKGKYNSTENDEVYRLNQNYRYKKHSYGNHLFEKEKIKLRQRFNDILRVNFKELDSCEIKFNSVIDKTLRLLSEYQDFLADLEKDDEIKEKNINDDI